MFGNPLRPNGWQTTDPFHDAGTGHSSPINNHVYEAGSVHIPNPQTIFAEPEALDPIHLHGFHSHYVHPHMVQAHVEHGHLVDAFYRDGHGAGYTSDNPVHHPSIIPHP